MLCPRISGDLEELNNPYIHSPTIISIIMGVIKLID